MSQNLYASMKDFCRASKLSNDFCMCYSYSYIYVVTTCNHDVMMHACMVDIIGKLNLLLHHLQESHHFVFTLQVSD